MYKILILSLLVMAPVVFSVETDNRIRLLFTTVETPDTRSDKYQEVPTPPMQEKPYNDAQLQKLRGEALEEALRKNNDVILANNTLKAAVFLDQYIRRVKQQDAILEKAKNTEAGRNLILVRDWFAGSMSKYSDLFLCVFRVDDEVAQKEKFYTGANAADVENSTYFVKLVIGDPSQESKSIPTSGGNTLTKRTTTQLITVLVQDMRNTLVFSENIEASIADGSSSVVMATGTDDVNGKALRKCLNSCAESIANKFSVELTIKIKGPKAEEDFAEDEVNIRVDGKPVSTGEAIRLAKGTHRFTLDMDGYKSIDKNLTIDKNVTKTFTMVNVDKGEKREE